MERLAYFIDGLNLEIEPLKSARRIADHLNAHLDVHHPWASRANLAGRPEWRPVSPDLIVGSGRSKARSMYSEVCGDREGTRFVGVDGHYVDVIRSFGSSYDFVVFDRLSTETGRAPYAFNTALFESGAPVLVLPPDFSLSNKHRVAVVWSGSCQSGRALRSSLPLLRDGKEVVVLSNSANPLSNPILAANYLAVHNIESTIEYFEAPSLSARGRGRSIIAAAVKLGADMLVMGAFGYNGIEQILNLGRTTQKLVTATPIPLLLQS